MQATPENLKVLGDYLNQTLSADYSVRKPAENYLEQLEGTENYAVLLLQLADSDVVDMNIRLAAAINFKNFVKRNWRVVDQQSKVSAADRNTIKKNIVRFMLKNPDVVQRQLSDAITIIGQEDFPNNWKGLLEEMVERFRSGDFHQINGVLRTAHSLTKRYRHEFKSQELWLEIKYVLDIFAAPFSELFLSTMQLVSQHSQNGQALQVGSASSTFSAFFFTCTSIYTVYMLYTSPTSTHSVYVSSLSLLHACAHTHTHTHTRTHTHT